MRLFRELRQMRAKQGRHLKTRTTEVQVAGRQRERLGQRSKLEIQGSKGLDQDF